MLQLYIEQEAAKQGLNRGDYDLAQQKYVLVNNPQVGPTLSRSDQTISHNFYGGAELVPGTPRPLKMLEFDLAKNLLFITAFEAYFADYLSFVQFKSANRVLRYDYLTNTEKVPSTFADEYKLVSDLITVHTGFTRVEAQITESAVCSASLSGWLLRPKK
jgi:hypothetical protein